MSKDDKQFRKMEAPRLAPHELEAADWDKGNTKNVSDSMLTYRREVAEIHQLGAGRWS